MARILVIEDSDPIRSLLRDTLELAGHTVIDARNGHEGLARFQHSTADLVITDMVMPKMEGFEVLQALRRTHPLVKIIAISGAGPDSGAGYLHMATLFGAAKVFVKPFAIAALIAAIDELLPGDV
jgi:DNA-binding response OmpR family regulator